MAKEHVTEKYVTGKGELTGFIALTKPSTKFDKEGVYRADILLPKEEGEKLLEKINNLSKEQFQKYGKGSKIVKTEKCVPFTKVNPDTGEEIVDKAGRYVLKTNSKAYIENGVPKFKPLILNAKKQPVKNISIGEGTVARLAVTLSGYSVAGKTGVSVKLGAVQIIDLVEYAGGGFSADAFDEEEGFDGVGEDFVEETNEAETSESEDEEVDF